MPSGGWRPTRTIWAPDALDSSMVASLLALGVMALGSAQGSSRNLDLPSPFGPESKVQIMENLDRLEIPKIAPKNPSWAYEWSASGFGRSRPGGIAGLRTVVYSQKPRGDHRLSVARLLMRLWEFNMNRFQTDNPSPCDGIVTVYLSFGGTAGGEQMFARDPQLLKLGGENDKVNTIYIYDIDTFKDPVQMVREIAHEYGHATHATIGGRQYLTDIGGFKEPEQWAAGYLGERLFMRWLRDQLRDGKLTPEDTMGATLEQLDPWVKAHCDPLEDAVAKNGPDFATLRRDDAKGMDALIGLVLYMERFLSASELRQTFYLNEQRKAFTLPAALLKTIEPKEEISWTFPTDWKGRAIWVPAGPFKIAGSTESKNDWAKVTVPEDGIVRLTKGK